MKSRTPIEKISANHYRIVKKRKSRIIMKDGEKILALAQEIRKQHPSSKVDVWIEGQLCSKTEKFLQENDITIHRKNHSG